MGAGDYVTLQNMSKRGRPRHEHPTAGAQAVRRHRERRRLVPSGDLLMGVWDAFEKVRDQKRRFIGDVTLQRHLRVLGRTITEFAKDLTAKPEEE